MTNLTHTFPRRADPILAAAQASNPKATTSRLLEALKAHEGDSDLGQLVSAILQAGDFYVRATVEEYEEAARAADDVESIAATLADGWRQSAEYYAEGAK